MTGVQQVELQKPLRIWASIRGPRTVLELQLCWSDLSAGIAALLVQPQHWKDFQPPGKREGWGGWNMGGWMYPTSSINKEPTSGFIDHHYHY
jgi:hypothetical protein